MPPASFSDAAARWVASSGTLISCGIVTWHVHRRDHGEVHGGEALGDTAPRLRPSVSMREILRKIGRASNLLWCLFLGVLSILVDISETPRSSKSITNEDGEERGSPLQEPKRTPPPKSFPRPRRWNPHRVSWCHGSPARGCPVASIA